MKHALTHVPDIALCRRCSVPSRRRNYDILYFSCDFESARNMGTHLLTSWTSMVISGVEC